METMLMDCLDCTKKQLVLKKYRETLDRAIKALAHREMSRGHDPSDRVLFDLFVSTQAYARSAFDDN